MKTVLDVIKEEIPFPEDFDMLTGELEISIKSGYIIVVRKNSHEHGSSETRYSYHPNSICEGKGICIYCGCTLFNNE